MPEVLVAVVACGKLVESDIVLVDISTIMGGVVVACPELVESVEGVVVATLANGSETITVLVELA